MNFSLIFIIQHFSFYFNSYRDFMFVFNYMKSDLFFKIVCNFCFFSFYKLAANDRGYGQWRFAGEFAVVKRQSECGSKTR